MSIRILIITSANEEHHKFEDYANRLMTILQNYGYDPKTVQSLDIVKQDGGLAEYNVVVFCGRHGNRDQAAEENLERFVHSRKGLVVIHVASSSFEGSPRWRKLLGRVWEYGPFDDFFRESGHPFTSNHPPVGAFRVDIINPADPITAGLQNFIIDRDERYQDLVVAPNATIHVLATANLEGRTEPVAWILVPPQGGRVFHVTLGHEMSTYENAGFKELLKRGLDWTSGQL